MAPEFTLSLDDHFAIRISPPTERKADAPPSDNQVLAQASIVIQKGPFANMQVSGFTVKSGKRGRYVTGPSHWWVNPTKPADDVKRTDRETGVAEKPGANRKNGRIEFFGPADDGLHGIPQRVQDVFLDAYDAYENTSE
jgi:hypothetical protein